MPLAVDAQEAARLTSLSVFTIRAYVRAKKLRAVRVGRRILIPMDALLALVGEGVQG